jgi:2-hydroxy-6-oxonona-2,4-dienedioate hydrolase
LIKQYPLGATVAATGSQQILTRVLEAGSGGDVVICVHGVGSRADRFRPTLEPLADLGYHVYAVDLPGHGLATKGALPLSVPYYAHYVAAIAQQLPAERMTLLGTSLGGHIGGYLSGIDGVHMDRLVMVGTLGIVPMPDADRQNINRVILRNRSVEDCVGKLKALLWDDDRVTQQWAEEESAINNSPGAEATFDRLGEYFEHHINDDLVVDAVRASLARIEMGVMWGDKDVIVDVDTGHAVRQALPEVPLAWIRDTGHAPYWERPEDFVTAMNMLFDPTARDADEFWI